MASFAQIDETNTVIQVIGISNQICGEPTLVFPDTDSAGRAFIANTLNLNGTWLQTSYNGSFRGCYAGVGYTYDAVADAFVAPQPFPSWSLDSNHDWQPPTPKPEGDWLWDESELSWVEVLVG
jgi:hypothetical protein